MGETARAHHRRSPRTAGRPISMVATADGPGQELAPTDAGEARQRLEALAPRPYAADYAGLLPPLDAAVRATAFGGVVWLSDGLAGEGSDSFGDLPDRAHRRSARRLCRYDAEIVALKPPVGAADALVVAGDPQQGRAARPRDSSAPPIFAAARSATRPSPSPPARRRSRGAVRTAGRASQRHRPPRHRRRRDRRRGAAPRRSLAPPAHRSPFRRRRRRGAAAALAALLHRPCRPALRRRVRAARRQRRRRRARADRGRRFGDRHGRHRHAAARCRGEGGGLGPQRAARWSASPGRISPPPPTR